MKENKIIKTKTLIIGSGISAYFAKKSNPNSIVISNSTKNASLSSGGYFRTKGINNKKLIDSIKKNSEQIYDDSRLNAFCNFTKKLNTFEEFKHSKKCKMGFISNLEFLKKFQKEIISAQLTDLIISKNKVLGALIKKNKKIKIIYCKSIILCTGGFSNYFNNKNKTVNPIELAFNKKAVLENIEFIMAHPFSAKNKIIPTENLANHKIYDYKLKRLINIENILSKKNAHHLLDKIVKKLYAKKQFAFFENNNELVKIEPLFYYTIGGLKVNKKYETNIKGLFCAGEISSGISGAKRIGGIGLSESVYSGVIAGKESKKYNKKENSTNSQKTVKINLKAKKQLPSKSFKFFKIINSKKNLEKGLNLAKLEKNNFAIAFFKTALKRKESRGFFIRSDFLKTIKKYQKKSVIKKA